MAGAGKRTFIAGEVLTAAQVNDFLMDQAVMRFSGSAARAASITVPTEGMVTYLDDSNAIEVYNGAAWVRMETASAYAANYSSKGQILVGAGAASFVAASIGTEGQILSAASAAPGGVSWVTPSGGGAAAYLTLAATGVTALPGTLSPGFYEIVLSNTNSYSSSQFRFVDSGGALYGASVTSGRAFFTIPTTVASINLSASAAGFDVLVREIPGVTETLIAAPTVTDFWWQELNSGCIAFTAPGSPTQVGWFNTATGSFSTASTATSPVPNASITTGASFGSDYKIVLVSRSATGTWSTANVTSASVHESVMPFQIFTGNGTYTNPSWGSGSVDVLVVSGGGAGGGSTNTAGQEQGGGAGAGGASVWTNYAVTGSVAVTIGAGGTAVNGGSGGNGVSSSFGALSTTAGGGGGRGGLAGSNGGSGGGCGNNSNTFGTGVTGQGNNGGAGVGSSAGGGGGKAEAGDTDGNAEGGDGTTQWGYAYGGGGSCYASGPDARPAGGFGGGGSGASETPGGAATANTGGGGGGARVASGPTSLSGGAGGSGVVIVKVRV